MLANTQKDYDELVVVTQILQNHGRLHEDNVKLFEYLMKYDPPCVPLFEALDQESEQYEASLQYLFDLDEKTQAKGVLWSKLVAIVIDKKLILASIKKAVNERLKQLGKVDDNICDGVDSYINFLKRKCQTIENNVNQFLTTNANPVIQLNVEQKEENTEQTVTPTPKNNIINIFEIFKNIFIIFLKKTFYFFKK